MTAEPIWLSFALSEKHINRIHINPPCSATIRTEGSKFFEDFGWHYRFFGGFQLILLRKIDQKRFKTRFLKRKSLLRGCIIKKNRICGAAILSIIPQKSCLRRSHSSKFQIYRRLSRSLHMHKTLFTVWMAR